MFNVEKTTKQAVQWIRDWFDKNGKGCNAVIGISGGKIPAWLPRSAWKHWEKTALSVC